MINVLDLDESNIVSQFKFEDWAKEFEAKFNAPLIEAQQQAMLQQQARQNQMMGVQNVDGK